MNKIIFSIIVPIYNTKIEYLESCFQSIEQQKLDNYEVILVNDCSTNIKTINYTNYFASKNKWKMVNNKNNVGLGESRNIGMQHSAGEYAIFLDSDDWIENNFLIEILNLINQKPEHCEFINFNFTWIYNNRAVINKHLIFKNKSTIVYGDATAWSKAYKLSFLRDNNIKFYNSKLPHEDEYWFLIILSTCGKFISKDIAIYNYNKKNDQSIMNMLSGINSLSALNIYLNEFLKYINDRELNDNITEQLWKYYLKPIYILLNFSNIEFSDFKTNINYFMLIPNLIKNKKKINFIYKNIYKGLFCYFIFCAAKTLKCIRQFIWKNKNEIN